MASEIPTNKLNEENSIILSLQLTLRALVICGLSNIAKFFTKNKTKLFSVSNNSDLNLKILEFLLTVCCVNLKKQIKEPYRPKIGLLEKAETTCEIIPKPGIIKI